MKSRQEFMAEIEFESRQKSGYRSTADVTLTISNAKSGSKYNRVNIYFRNGVKEHFPEGVMFGIYKNRIIFEPSATNGYKITTSSTNRTDYGFISATVSDIEKYRDWIGDYKLLWDSFYEFWFIAKGD